MKFHEGNKFLIFAATLAGLYMPRIAFFMKRKELAKYYKIIRIIPYTFLPVYIGSLIKNLFFDEGKFLQKTYSITAIAGSGLVNFKLFHYLFIRRKLEDIMNYWDDAFEEDLFPAQREKMLIKRNKETGGFIKFMVIMTVVSGALYGAVPFLHPDKDLGHPSGFLRENKSPDYELVVGFEMISQAIGLGSLLTYDAILLIFMSLEDAQLAHLKHSLAAIVGSFKIEKTGFVVKSLEKEKFEGEELEAVENRLKTWVKLHQNLIKYHEKLQDAYHFSLCVQFSVLMCMVCFIAFLNLTNGFTPKERVMSVFFILGSYTVFYRTCNYGDNIKITNNLIFEDAFTEAWYIYPKKIQTILNVIILRSHRPLNIVAFNIYPLGARSFSIIFRTAYGFFSFLMQIMNKK